MEHHLRHLPKNYTLFIPEVLVELQKKQDTKHPGVEEMTLLHLAKDHHVTLYEQEEALKRAEKAKMERYSRSDLDKGSIEALQAVDECISNIGRQKKEYERLQAKATEENKIRNTGRDLPQNHTYEEIHHHEMGEHQHSSTSTTGKQQDSHGKLGDDQSQNEPVPYQLHQLRSSALDLEEKQQRGANQWQQHFDTAVSSLSPEASEGGRSVYQQKELLVLQTKCEELKDSIREKENTIQETIRARKEKYYSRKG